MAAPPSRSERIITEFKALLPALIASLGLHALAAFPVSLGLSPREDETVNLMRESIPIAYVEPPISKSSAPSKKESIPRPKNGNIQKPQTSPSRVKPFRQLVTSDAFSRRPSKREPVTWRSDQLLTDPEKGKIFSNYFAMVKEKIRQTVRQRYDEESDSRGSVSLFFVLNSNGWLENVSVVKQQSWGDPLLSSFALRCLKETAPFPSFPAKLGVERISFSVIVAFDGETA